MEITSQDTLDRALRVMARRRCFVLRQNGFVVDDTTEWYNVANSLGIVYVGDAFNGYYRIDNPKATIDGISKLIVAVDKFSINPIEWMKTRVKGSLNLATKACEWFGIKLNQEELSNLLIAIENCK